MALIPDTKTGKIAFYGGKIAPWTSAGTSIGTTTAAVTALNTLLTSATTKMAAQVAAAAAAKTATEAADAAVDALAFAGANIIADIRAFARNSSNPAAVYELAQIPAPAIPTPVSTLGTPTNFTAELNADGSVTFKWKCASPRASGVIYQIWRRLGGTGEFAYLGGSGEKEFTDRAIPAGSSQVTYQLQAVRSTAAGGWAQFNVNFGMSSGGTMTVTSVTETAPSKIAA